MARIDVRTSTVTDGHILIQVATHQTELTTEEAGELAQQLLSKLGCSFQIRWPDSEPTLDERVAQRKTALSARRAKAEEYVDEAWPLRSADPLIRDALVQAYINGHDASPKPLHHPYR